MKILANQAEVARRVTALREDGATSDGWDTFFVDEGTGRRWRRIYLGSAYHGAGMPVLIEEPMPSVAELLDLVDRSDDSAEVAAGAWLLSETDDEGAHKDALVSLAEAAARRNDQARAALLVGWGNLLDEMNLRPPLGKPAHQVVSDHDYFKAIAARARRVLQLKNDDPLLRDPRVFAIEF